MAAKKVEKKRRNKRKARTEVSSSSSSSSDSSSESSASEPQQEIIPQNAKNHASKKADAEETALNSESDEAPVFTPTQKRLSQDPEKSFEDFYLRQATREFANDLDKLRSAGDFNERSIPLLISALKQGTACFSRDERRRIGEMVAT